VFPRFESSLSLSVPSVWAFPKFGSLGLGVPSIWVFVPSVPTFQLPQGPVRGGAFWRLESESVKDNHFELTRIESAFSAARLGTAQHRLEVSSSANERLLAPMACGEAPSRLRG